MTTKPKPIKGQQPVLFLAADLPLFSGVPLMATDEHFNPACQVQVPAPSPEPSVPAVQQRLPEA